MYGGQTQDAVRALTGALKGNNTMLDNYGMAVNDSIVKTRALELGLVKQGKEMSLAAKQAATLSLIYEQSAAAQGQAAREADGASGSMRALKTEITNLTTEIGTMLLPMITPLVNKVKEVVGWFKNLQPETKKLIVIIGAAAAAIGPLLIGLGAILKLTPLVGAAFTVITGPIGIAVTAIGAAAGAIIYFWDDIKRGVLNAVAAIQRGIAGVFEKMAGWAAKLGFDSVSQSLKDLSGEFSYFANNTTQQASEIGQGIDGLSDSFKGITQVPLAETVDLTSLSLDNLGNSVTKTQKETRNFRNELDDLMASWGSYEAKLKVLNREYTEISSIAKKAGASVGEMQTIASRKWVDRALLEFGRFTGGLNELPLTIKTFDLTPKITVPDILPNFDEALKLVDAKSKMFVDKFQLMTDDIKNILETGIENSVYNMFDSIGNAFATGGSIIGAIGDSLVAGLGSLASNIGKQMIAFGVAGIALKKLMMNPYLAVAAGAALVALGSFATSSVSKQTSSYSGGYSSSSNNIGAQSNDYSKFRGALYNDDKQVVELKLKNGELTGAIKIGANRNNRLG